MDILVVGATGRTGRLVVQQALDRGHRVRALSRSVRQEDVPGATVFQGSVLDADLVADAVDGVEAIVVTLSMVRANPNNPWSRITTPEDLHERAARTLLGVAPHHTRYVTMSAHGVGTSRANAGWLFMGLVDASNIGVAYRALEVAESVVAQHPHPWTVVRPTRLTNGGGGGDWRFTSGERLSSRAAIDRADVATALLELAEGREHVQEKVSLTTHG